MKNYVVCLIFALASLTAVAQQSGANSDWQHKFQVSSTTFTNGGDLPLSMILSSNNCTYVSGGGDQSPQLSWQHAPFGTQSLVVTLYDVTAAFTHWGMYNISPEATGLPQGTAGMAGSPFGQQVDNDFGLGEQYDGPCPPTNLTPATHEYVLTVYALDVELTLPKGSADFPPDGEILFHKLIDAGREGHILQSASIRGFFSAGT